MADVATVKAQTTSQEILQKRIGAVESEDALKKEEKLKKACANFESILTYYMFKTMRQSIPQNGYFKQNPGKDTYYMLFDQKVAEEMSNKGKGAGLQQALFNQLSNHR
ncbi:MAG: rod-binding protein [Syntrophales bacterium]|jgi:peptidoglycan hydrolase FlgJ